MKGKISEYNKKNVVLVDTMVGDDWEFVSGLTQSTNEEWTILCWNNAGLMKSIFDNLKRYAGYFGHSFGVFIRRKKYKRIVAWQQFYGLFFSFFCSVFKVKKDFQLTIMTFIYKEKKGIIGKIYKKFISLALLSGYIDCCVVFSNYEVRYYAKIFHVPENNFIFFPLGIESNIVVGKMVENIHKPYFLSVGRSNRDYNFLLDSIKDIDQTVVIVTDNIQNKEKYESDKIIFFDNVKGEEYLKILKDCFAVLIPLDNPAISSGQLVILQAMKYMKPIIVTSSETLSDYVINGYNAIVCEKNKKEFLDAIEKITTNPQLYKRLADNGKKEFDEKFSLLALGKNIGKSIK